MRNKSQYEQIAEVYNREQGTRIVLREDENGSMTPVIELDTQEVVFNPRFQTLLTLFNIATLHKQEGSKAIHHQKNDYIFHPYCTDFIGDSDSSKSIIADLLQLIFVGSSVFRSATIPVKDRREPDGLVLRSPGKSLDYGYAFVNIEIANGQFVTVSAYLESTSKATRPFIVQAGLTIEQDDSAPCRSLFMPSIFKMTNVSFH